jgi:hypothetical protein
MTMMRLAAVGLVAALATPALADIQKAPPGRGFRKVSDLAALPTLMPGLGILYVRPKTLPTGPFLAYDRKGRLVSTIYMIPIDDMAKRKKFDLAGFGRRADHVTMHFNSGHPGVDVPHYHVVVWHVSKRAESRVAK